MTANIATIGHNNPPDQLEQIKAEHSGLLSEIENWLDGEPVDSEEQMGAVDDLLKCLKEVEKAAKDAKESEYRPHKNACDAVVERWQPYLTDLTRMKQGLTAIVQDFKRKLKVQREDETRRKAEKAEAARRDAEAALEAADMKNLEERRKADKAAFEAREADREAQAAKKRTVGGLRRVTAYEVTDYRACINWIAEHDKDAIRAFCDDYAKRMKNADIDGVTRRVEERAI